MTDTPRESGSEVRLENQLGLGRLAKKAESQTAIMAGRKVGNVVPNRLKNEDDQVGIQQQATVGIPCR
jgi:hypothetical protein